MTSIKEITVQIDGRQQNVFLKLENQNVTGSHKDRGLQEQIKRHIERGVSNFVISSSGNAAVSASYFCKQNKVPLTVFLSPKTPGSKIDRLYEYPGLKVEFSKRPKHDAFQVAKNSNAVSLRASTDKFALSGYETLASELIEQVPGCSDLFFPVSSGTSLVGTYLGYSKFSDQSGNNEKSALSSKSDKLMNPDTNNKKFKIPRFHVVQSTRVYTIAEEFDNDFAATDSSLAQAIVDRVAHRKKQVVDIIKKTGGSGWVVGDTEIESVLNFIPKEINSSNEGAMALAGLTKAISSGWEAEVPVCIITGLGSA